MRSSIVGCSTTQVRIVCAKRRIDIGALQDHPNFPLPLPGANALNLASLISLDSTVSQILVASCVSDRDLTVLDLTRFSQLRRLVIGDNCFQFVKELRLIGFQELVSVKIGCQCFATSTVFMNGDSRCDFYLKNCPKLQYLTIDGFSFANASVFEIENVDALVEIDMGDVDEESINFQDASLLLKSA